MKEQQGGYHDEREQAEVEEKIEWSRRGESWLFRGQGPHFTCPTIMKTGKNGVVGTGWWAHGVAHLLRDLAMWSEAIHTEDCRGNASGDTPYCPGAPCCVYHHLKPVMVTGDPMMVSRKCSLFLLRLLALLGSLETLSTQPDSVGSSATSALS